MGSLLNPSAAHLGSCSKQDDHVVVGEFEWAQRAALGVISEPGAAGLFLLSGVGMLDRKRSLGAFVLRIAT